MYNSPFFIVAALNRVPWQQSFQFIWSWKLLATLTYKIYNILTKTQLELNKMHFTDALAMTSYNSIKNVASSC